MLFAVAAAVVHAEVSVDSGSGATGTIVMASYDDPDPISVLWQPFRSIPPAAGGRLWLDWKDDPGAFGCAEYVGATWNAGAAVAWTDPSWVGVEATRQVIRADLLGH
jgi:hypothetical protein